MRIRPNGQKSVVKNIPSLPVDGSSWKTFHDVTVKYVVR